MNYLAMLVMWASFPAASPHTGPLLIVSAAPTLGKFSRWLRVTFMLPQQNGEPIVKVRVPLRFFPREYKWEIREVKGNYKNDKGKGKARKD